MGADIHVFLERRPKGKTDLSLWEVLAERVRMDRDYLLFALMAKVRVFSENLVLQYARAPKGLPPEYVAFYPQIVDALEREKVEPGHLEAFLAWVYGNWDATGKETVDAHSHSYFGLEELQAIQHDYMRVTFRQLSTPSSYPHSPAPASHLDLEAIIHYLAVHEGRGYETRLVCWFDN